MTFSSYYPCRTIPSVANTPPFRVSRWLTRSSMKKFHKRSILGTPRPWSSSRPDVVESVSEMKIVGMGTTQTPRVPSYKNCFLHSVRVFRAKSWTQRLLHPPLLHPPQPTPSLRRATFFSASLREHPSPPPRWTALHLYTKSTDGGPCLSSGTASLSAERTPNFNSYTLANP